MRSMRYFWRFIARYFAVSIMVFSALAITTAAIAQSARSPRRYKSEKKQAPAESPAQVPGQTPAHVPAEDRAQSPIQSPAQSEDSVKMEVDLVNVPVIASNGSDAYVYDLQKEDFTLTEDGVNQEIVFFGSVREPFHV